MKKSELIFGAILLPIDYLMLVLAGLSAYSLRFGAAVNRLQPALYTIPFRQFLSLLFVTALFGVAIFALNGLYQLKATRHLIEEIRKIFFSCSTGVLIIITLFFLNRDLFSSRFIILAAYGFSLIYVTLARIIVIFIERQFFLKGIGVRQIVLIGNNHIGSLIAQEMQHKPRLGMKVKMNFVKFTPEASQEILQRAQENNIDEIILTDTSISSAERSELQEFCDENHLVFKYAATLLDTPPAHLSIQPIAGIPVIEIQKTPLDGWGRIAKRAVDIIVAVFLLIIFSPLMLVIALMILIDSGRPVFFFRRDDDQMVKRIGQNGQPFFYFKFRTMKPGTDFMRYSNELQQRNLRKGSPLFKMKDDPRVTRVGKWLRRFSLDELPEFFLVLKGDMSLVGPRPHLPEEVAKYQKHHKKVLRVKPGVTGLAQISGRSDLDFADEMRLDTFYVEHWSLWLDLIIFFKTPFILLKRRRAL